MKARVALKEQQPIILKEEAIFDSLEESTKKCLKNLIETLNSEKTENEKFTEDITPEGGSAIDPRQL